MIGPGELLKPKIGFHRETKKTHQISSGNQKSEKQNLHLIDVPYVCFNMAVPWPCNVHMFPFQKPLKPKVGFHRETKKNTGFHRETKKNTGFHREARIKTSENQISIGVRPCLQQNCILLAGLWFRVTYRSLFDHAIRKFAKYSKAWYITDINKSLAQQPPPRLAINCRGNSGKLMSVKI